MTGTVDLSIVIVSWESDAELAGCVRSLAVARESAAPVCELIIVDNASSTFPADELLAAWPAAQLIVNEVNRGFGPAANQGVERASGSVVLLLNPDTRAEDDPLTPLVDLFADRSDVVAAAPRLLDDGAPAEEPQDIFQLRRLPTWRQAFRELLLFDKAFPRNAGLHRDRYLDRDRDQPFAVEQPAAAALAVRREAFTALGGFDEGFVPAWWEDVDLCARLAPHGVILYWPASRFVHAGGAAASGLGYDRFLPIYYCNACRFWRKHHGAAAALAYRLLVAAGMALRLLVLPLRGSLPRSRRQAARAYAGALATALGFRRLHGHVPGARR